MPHARVRAGIAPGAAGGSQRLSLGLAREAEQRPCEFTYAGTEDGP